MGPHAPTLNSQQLLCSAGPGTCGVGSANCAAARPNPAHQPTAHSRAAVLRRPFRNSTARYKWARMDLAPGIPVGFLPGRTRRARTKREPPACWACPGPGRAPRLSARVQGNGSPGQQCRLAQGHMETRPTAWETQQSRSTRPVPNLQTGQPPRIPQQFPSQATSQLKIRSSAPPATRCRTQQQPFPSSQRLDLSTQLPILLPPSRVGTAGTTQSHATQTPYSRLMRQHIHPKHPTLTPHCEPTSWQPDLSCGARNCVQPLTRRGTPPHGRADGAQGPRREDARILPAFQGNCSFSLHSSPPQRRSYVTAPAMIAPLAQPLPTSSDSPSPPGLTERPYKTASQQGESTAPQLSMGLMAAAAALGSSGNKPNRNPPTSQAGCG